MQTTSSSERADGPVRGALDELGNASWPEKSTNETLLSGDLGEHDDEHADASPATGVSGRLRRATIGRSQSADAA